MNKAILALAAAIGIGASTEARADETNLTAETMIFNDFHSDTRVEIESDGLEAAVEQITNDDYTWHQTLFGLRTPQLGGFELRQTGILQYGADLDGNGEETEGAFNTNLLYTIPDTNFRLGVGGGILFPARDFITHVNAQYWGEALRITAGGMYDSARGEFDARGFVSLFASPIYVSLGKAAGPNFINRFGLVQGVGQFNAGIINVINYETLASSHSLFMTWNSTYDQGAMDFKTNLFAGADGLSDFVFDPTIGWAPLLNMFGEHSISFDLSQSRSRIDGSVLFAYNPNNAGSFIEAGAGYGREYSTNDNDVTTTLNVGTGLGPVNVAIGTKTELTERELSLWLYAEARLDYNKFSKAVSALISFLFYYAKSL